MLIGNLGGILVLVAVIMIAIEAFKESVLWGVLCIIIAPIIPLIYAIMHIDRCRNALIILIIGMVIAGGGYGLGTRII